MRWDRGGVRQCGSAWLLTSEGSGSYGEAVSVVLALDPVSLDIKGRPPSVGVSFSSVPLAPGAALPLDVRATTPTAPMAASMMPRARH